MAFIKNVSQITSKRLQAKERFSIIKTVCFLFLFAALAQVSSFISNSSKSSVNVIDWSLDSILFREPMNERMYTHETSGKGYLNLRQTCTVESAAKHNPTLPIQVFIKNRFLIDGGKYDRQPWLQILSQYPNVAIVVINETTYFKDTPLQKWYEEGKWKKSEHWIEHLSDYIRMVSLWRNGGLYFDLDIIFRKPIDLREFRNFLLCGNQFCDSVYNGMFHFDHGHKMNVEIVDILASRDYNGTIFAAHGLRMLTRLMRDRCKFKKNLPFSNQCDDVFILPHSFVYPLPFTDHALIRDTSPKHVLKWLLPSYGVHMWNKLSRDMKLDVNSNSVFAALAAENCPVTVKLSKEFFD